MLNDIKKKPLDLMIYIMTLYDNFLKVVCNNKNQHKNPIYLTSCCKNIIYMYMYYKVFKKNLQVVNPDLQVLGIFYWDLQSDKDCKKREVTYQHEVLIIRDGSSSVEESYLNCFASNVPSTIKSSWFEQLNISLFLFFRNEVVFIFVLLKKT